MEGKNYIELVFSLISGIKKIYLNYKNRSQNSKNCFPIAGFVAMVIKTRTVSIDNQKKKKKGVIVKRSKERKVLPYFKLFC